MDPDMVVVAEGLPEGVDGIEALIGRVKRVDTLMGAPPAWADLPV